MQRAQRQPWLGHWRRCKVLVVDEVSMLDGRLFLKLERVARLVRRSDRPFGGIQLVLCGDFLQLPPVSRRDEPKAIYCFQVYTASHPTSRMCVCDARLTGHQHRLLPSVGGSPVGRWLQHSRGCALRLADSAGSSRPGQLNRQLSDKNGIGIKNDSTAERRGKLHNENK